MNKADKEETKPNFAFVAMPMDKTDHQLVDVLDAIKDAAKSCGIMAERIDDTESNERITDRMLKQIDSAKYVIADLTKGRPNVFFEAGYSEGRGKTPIYVARQGTEIHFDTNDYPIIFFHNMKELKEGLQRRFIALSKKVASGLENASDQSSDRGTEWIQSTGEPIAAEASRIDRDRPFLGDPPIVAFSKRFSLAFPGVRSVAWFDDVSSIAKRLTALLKAPLRFEEGDIAWWWRGDSSLQIERFEHVEGSHFLMNVEELNVSRIAAVNPGSYYRQFVYVETRADKPTGLSPRPTADICRAVETFGYASEEYGRVGNIGLISRAQYDDGATVIGGNPIDVSGIAELRVRYITPYNFIIAPNETPINNHEFDDEMEKFLNQLLQGKNVFDDMCNAIGRFPKRHW